MKKFFIVICVALFSSSVFAVGTVNVGFKADGCNVISSIGYDILAHSFNKSELWIEPRIDLLGATIDNTEKTINYGCGLSFTNVYFSNGFFYGGSVDWTRSKFDDDNIIQGWTVGIMAGFKMYHNKLYVGLDKGFYKCDGDDKRIEGTKKPLMLAVGTEIFF